MTDSAARLRLAFACPGCGAAVEGEVDGTTATLTCGACGRATDFVPGALGEDGTFARCPVCASPDLYAQRDFNRVLGLAIVGVGLGLGPFTSWISVGVAVLLDAGLYVVVPSVAICYACNAQVRGLPKRMLPAAFDIAVHDAYKFGKRFPPRRGLAVAGPLAKRLRLEGKPVQGF